MTSPPYWRLRDYGIPGQIGQEKTPEEYIRTLVCIFSEVKRVLKDTGSLDDASFTSIHADVDELGGILFAILKTTRIRKPAIDHC